MHKNEHCRFFILKVWKIEKIKNRLTRSVMSMGGNPARGQLRLCGQCCLPVWSTARDMVDRMSLMADRQAFCVAASGGDRDPGMSPLMSGVSVICERDSFAGMSPVMSRVPAIRDRGCFVRMSPLMSRVSVICERDSFTGISPVAGTGQQAGIRSRCDLVSEQLLCRRKPQMYGNHFF